MEIQWVDNFNFFNNKFSQKNEKTWTLDDIKNKTDTTMGLTAYFTEEWRCMWFDFMTNPDEIMGNIEDVTYHNPDYNDETCNPRQIHWGYLSANVNTTLEFIENNPDFPWVFGVFKGWDWSDLNCGISANPNLTMEFIKKHPDKKWNWNAISQNPAITMDIIENNLANKEADFQWENVSDNPNLTMEFVKKHQHFAWNWLKISCHKNITMSDIKSNFDMPWNWVVINRNPNLTMEFVDEFFVDEFKIKQNLDWSTITSTATMETIINNPNKPWKFQNLCRSKHATLEFIQKYIKCPLPMWMICNISCYNMTLTIDNILEYPDDFWCWNSISNRPKITINDIENNSDKPWDFTGMTTNPNLTMNFVRKHANKDWNWMTFGKNAFAVDKQQYIETQIQKALLAYIHDHYKNNTRNVATNFECVLFDEYIMSKVIAY